MKQSTYLFTTLFAMLLLLASCSEDKSTTPNGNSDDEAFRDFDGNAYKTVQIGDQVWMAENLKVTHYRNGDKIKLSKLTYSFGHAAMLGGALYGYYDDDPKNSDIYGLLYNWHVINDSRGLAPEGWHIPTDDEWKIMEMYLGMSQSEANGEEGRGTDEGGKLKTIGNEYDGTGLWGHPNIGATNSSGFSALPGGAWEVSGQYNGLEIEGNWWTSTQNDSGKPLHRRLNYIDQLIWRESFSKANAFSVRCVKD